MDFNISSKNGFKLYSNLMDISDEVCHYKKHGVRHPADTLSLTIKALSLAFNDFWNHKDNHNFDERKDKSIKDYILALDSFYEHMFHIIKTFCSADAENNKDVTKWLTNNCPENFNKFKDATSSPHTLIRKIANIIKHDTHRIDYLSIKNSNKKIINGFYFSTIVGSDDLSGPDPDIHKEHQDSATAISYNFFARYSIGFVACCLFHLNKILFNSKRSTPHNPQDIFKIFQTASTVGDDLFPDEYNKSLAIIQPSNASIIISFPKKIKSNTHIISIEPTFKINERTKKSHDTWPYFKLLA